MFFDFKQYPGHLFIVATLLPLLSFILILLAGAVWSALRPYQKKPAIKPLFDLFGGDEERPNRGRWAAWTATGAIGLAFLLCLSGGIRYFQELPNDERKATKSKRTISELLSRMHGSPEKRKEFSKELIAARQELENVEGKWDGHWTWATVHPQHLPRDPTDFDEEAGEEHAEDSGTVLRLGFHIDALSVVMFVMVTLIATLIHLFSIGYMSEELQPVVEDHQVHTAHGHYHRRGRFGRFFLYLSLFCFSMLNLILADNLFQVFLSWELVGICSYLLIGFYFERQSASNAANKAFIVNRVGDAGFIIGILILFTYVGTLNFNEIFARIRSPLADTQRQLANGGRMVRASVAKVTEDGKVLLVTGRSANSGSELVLFPSNMDADFNGLVEGDVQFAYNSPPPKAYGSMPYWLIVLAGLGIFLGCMGKSAQFPLQVWLPDAMEGPTPVSALIHAATMVAAGVYLVGRCYPLFTPEALLVIAYVGAITLFVAATVAVVMTDIKKVLAYSTVSQLGYMMLALGVGGWVAGLFHLITHAFFKALLFLCSGSVIYGCHHEQDMTKMGGLLPKMRITAISMLVGVLTIAGIPLFSGWYSKDAILASAFGFVYLNHHHALLFLLPLITAGITTFYMFRMWLLTFTGKPRDQHVFDHAHESPALMTAPLVILAVFSVCVAWGTPVWDATASHLEHHLHHAQPTAVVADFGQVLLEGEGDVEFWRGAELPKEQNQRLIAHEYHGLAGALAMLLVAIGILFAFLLYYSHVLDPAEAQEQFPAVHRFLSHKWYFDELYSAMLVRPVLVVSHALKWIDLKIIDGFLHFVAWLAVKISKWDGIFDRTVIDGSVNLLAHVTGAVGNAFRRVQTGFLRSYVLFMVLAAVGIFVAILAL